MGKAWPEEVRERAIALAVSEGLPAAQKATGVPRPTVHSWLRARGLSAWSEQSDRERTEAARKAADAALDRYRSNRVTLLTAIGETGMTVTLRRLAGGAEAAAMSEVVGAWTRANHDLRLAMSEVVPTGQQGQVVVNFNVGRSPVKAPTVVPEAALGGS